MLADFQICISVPLNINYQRTTSAKSINLNNTRKLMEYSRQGYVYS